MIAIHRVIAALFVGIPLLAGFTAAVTPALSQTVNVRGIGGVAVQSIHVRILAIDLPSRTVQVENKGRQWRVTLPEEFGPLTNIRVRDRLQINRVQGVAIGVAPAKRGAKPSVASSVATNDGTFDALPARWVVRKMRVTGTFKGLDAATGILSYDGPEGPGHVHVVAPEVLAAAGKLKKGAMIVVDYAEATEFVLTKRP